MAVHLKLPTEKIGEFSLDLGYTHVFDHTIRQYPGDPIEDKLAYYSGYYIPQEKGTASLSWKLDDFTATLNGQRLGKLPNWNEDAYIKATYLFNLSVQYNVTENLRLSGTVNNLFRPEAL